MDNIYDWVDDNAEGANRSFSGRRVIKLFVAVMASSIIAGVPLGLWELTVDRHKRADAERLKKEQLNREWQALGEAARDGKTGEAFRRLLEVKPDDKGK